MSERDGQSEAWMQALIAGDNAALEPLITLWQQPVLRFVFRYVQNEAEARDIVQETFVRLYVKRGSFRADMQLSSWILTIAANLCRNRMRWRARHRWENIEAESAFLTCARPAPDRAAEQTEEVLAVRAALAGLPHDLKLPLLLHEYEHLSYAEIAPVAGCSVKGVEARLARARARLRAALAPFLADGTTGAAARRVPATLSADLAATVSK